MDVIRIKTHLNSETLTLPELKPLVGHDVEIVVREENGASLSPAEADARRLSLKGSVLRDDDPFGPATPPGDWEALS
jgi:hypothetical protein